MFTLGGRGYFLNTGKPCAAYCMGVGTLAAFQERGAEIKGLISQKRPLAQEKHPKGRDATRNDGSRHHHFSKATSGTMHRTEKQEVFPQ